MGYSICLHSTLNSLPGIEPRLFRWLIWSVWSLRPLGHWWMSKWYGPKCNMFLVEKVRMITLKRLSFVWKICSINRRGMMSKTGPFLVDIFLSARSATSGASILHLIFTTTKQKIMCVNALCISIFFFFSLVYFFVFYCFVHKVKIK